MEPWGNDSPNRQIHLSPISSSENGITSYCEKVSYTEEPDPRESEETLLQLVLPAVHQEVTLKGCHDEVGHLGLERILDLMCDWFILPCMDAQVKEHIKSVAHASLSMPSIPRPLWKTYCGHTSLRVCPP